MTKYTDSVFKFYNEQDERKFSDYYIANSLLMVIRSFNLIGERIRVSNINPEFKEMFAGKLQTFYLCKLKESLFKLTDLFNRVDALNDNYTSEIRNFYIEHKSKN